jgi:hypothetical protein
MNRKSYLRSGLTALVLALLAGCSGAQSAGSPNVGPDGSSAPSVSAASTPDATAEPRSVSFTERYRLDNGLVMSVTGITHGELGEFPVTDDPNAKKGDPYTVITISLHNGGAKTIDALLNGTVLYGKDQKQAYRHDLGDIGSTPTIQPGETAACDMGFLIPVADRGQVQLKVTVDIGQHEAAHFAGSIED